MKVRPPPEQQEWQKSASDMTTRRGGGNRTHLWAHNAPVEVVPELVGVRQRIEGLVVVEATCCVVAELLEGRHVHVALGHHKEVHTHLQRHRGVSESTC